MKKIIHLLMIAGILILNQCISSDQNPQIIPLDLKNGVLKGSFEIIENTIIGTAAIQRAPGSSVITWNTPPELKAGWYRINFTATSKFQVIAANLDENEPFIFTITESGYGKDQSSFTFKVPDGSSSSLDSLPGPLLNPTEVQTWRSSQPLYIDEKSKIEMAVRRPLLIVGEINLESLPENELTRLTIEGEAPYNMFTDDKEVIFQYKLENLSGKAFKGKLQFVLKDVVDGNEQVRHIPVKIEANGSQSGNLEWTPDFGGYRLSTETLNKKGKILYSEQRHFTFSPAIDPKELPDTWPVAFHRAPGSPEMIPPIGAKWVRLWGGWGNMEPEPGKYDWSLMDANVRMAQKYGHLLLWACHGVPNWSLPEDVKDKPRAGAHYAPADINRIRPFLREFWKRYAETGLFAGIEIGNEPNAHPGWSPEKYGELARAIYEETHQATEGIRVVGISMSGGTHMDYMEKALNAGLNKYMDIASLHLYEVANPIGDRSIHSKTSQFMQKMKDHGLGDMPVWNTESGSSTDIRQDGMMVSQEELNRQLLQHTDFDPKIPWRLGNEWRAPSELLGTAYMIRASYQQFAMGVEKNFIFQWSASPHYTWVHDWKPGGNVMPKIKVVAAAMMSKMLLDYGPAATQDQPEVDSPKGWYAFAHRFEGPKGRMTIAYVHPNIYAGSGDPVAALAAGDDDIKNTGANYRSPWLRSKQPDAVSIKIPMESPQVIVMDMFGKRSETIRTVNGFVEIAGTEVPQYLLELN